MAFSLNDKQIEIMKPIVNYWYKAPIAFTSQGIVHLTTSERISWVEFITVILPLLMTGGKEPEALDVAEEFMYHIIYDNKDELVTSVKDAFLEKHAEGFAEFEMTERTGFRPTVLTETKAEFEHKAAEDTDILMKAFSGGGHHTCESGPEEEVGIESGEESHDECGPSERPAYSRKKAEEYVLPTLVEKPKEDKPKNPWGEVEES